MKWWSLFAWVSREVLAYALPTLLAFAAAYQINIAMDDIRYSQEQLMQLMLKVYSEHEEQNRLAESRINNVELELSMHKLRIVSIELQLQRRPK